MDDCAVEFDTGILPSLKEQKTKINPQF
jgi:hypothetical protein